MYLPQLLNTGNRDPIFNGTMVDIPAGWSITQGMIPNQYAGQTVVQAGNPLKGLRTSIAPSSVMGTAVEFNGKRYPIQNLGKTTGATTYNEETGNYDFTDTGQLQYIDLGNGAGYVFNSGDYSKASYQPSIADFLASISHKPDPLSDFMTMLIPAAFGGFALSGFGGAGAATNAAGTAGGTLSGLGTGTAVSGLGTGTGIAGLGTGTAATGSLFSAAELASLFPGAFGSAAAGLAGGSGMSWIDELLADGLGGYDVFGSASDLPSWMSDELLKEGLPSWMFEPATEAASGLDPLGELINARAAEFGAPTSFDYLLQSAKDLGMNPSSVLKLFGGDGNALNTSNLLGTLLSSGLGAYAANKQTSALEELAKRYEGYGAPYRQRLSDLTTNPLSFLTSPEVTTSVNQGTQALMRALSTQGNPFGSGNALQQGQSYATDQLFGRLGQEKDRLAGYGGLTTYNAAAPQASTNAINSTSNMWNALGSGVSNIFNPPKTMAQTMADFYKSLGQ